MILGIDEVGRGPWAGPLVVGAVVLGGQTIDGLTDSKKLAAKRRERLNAEIHDKAAAIGLGWVSAGEIDEIGLGPALKLATRRAVEQITVPYHEIIIDGTINLLADTGKADYVTTLKQADLLIPSVSAASIVAKVARDEYMTRLVERHPGYGFERHVGYGTAAHRAAIEQHGVTPEHRLSIAPLQKYRKDIVPPVEQKFDLAAPTTRQIGDASENAAADELQRRGHDIMIRNWKTKLCEIDIVSRRDDILYFVEVKHRKNSVHGDGVAAITPRKLRQMKFAAKLFIAKYNLDTMNQQLLVISTTGEPPSVENLIELE